MDRPVSILHYDEDSEEIRRRMGLRSSKIDASLIHDVARTIEDVKERGDEAVLAATAKYDSVRLSSIRVDPSEVSEARRLLDAVTLSTLKKAAQRIEKYNSSLLGDPSHMIELEAGIGVGEKVSPLPSAGVWVPSKKGPLASTMLMLVVPARVAGVKEIVAATPPLPDGTVDPATLAAASLAGATQVVRGNGVALVAAMAFGTESVPRVEAIYGPGPPAVMAAMGYVGIYGVRTGPTAGPSECMVIADESADPDEAAADLLTECEHGPDSSSVLVTTSPLLASRVRDALTREARNLPEPRCTYVDEALSRHGMIVVVNSLDQAAEFANTYAPEHLQLALGKGEMKRTLDMITNAGEILLGQSTPFSAANYAIGITAVLPTGASARRYSGITVRDFLKTSTIGSVDPAALPRVCDIVTALGTAEGFPAHVEACRRKYKARRGCGAKR